jgi:hypothetical protein
VGLLTDAVSGQVREEEEKKGPGRPKGSGGKKPTGSAAPVPIENPVEKYGPIADSMLEGLGDIYKAVGVVPPGRIQVALWLGSAESALNYMVPGIADKPLMPFVALSLLTWGPLALGVGKAYVAHQARERARLAPPKGAPRDDGKAPDTSGRPFNSPGVE